MKKNTPFTIIELLVVIAVISILASMLIPALSLARKKAQSIKCLSNLKQIGLMAANYNLSFNDYFPPAQDGSGNAWDTSSTGGSGLIYEGSEYTEIQQCPAMDQNISPDRFTGYNYNTTYIGHGAGEAIPAPSKMCEIRNPVKSAVFGDAGSVLNTALVNKYMRAPNGTRRGGAPAADAGMVVSGAQDYSRHKYSTNIGWADGHAESWKDLKTPFLVYPSTGFLSYDDEIYDLD